MTAINLAAPLATLFGWPLLVYVFGIISITRLITTDSIIDGWRDRFFSHWPHEGYQSMKRPHRGTFITTSGGGYYVNVGTKLGDLIHCPWCTGFWVAAGLFAAFVAWPVGTTFFLTPLAFRVVAGAFQALTD